VTKVLEGCANQLLERTLPIVAVRVLHFGFAIVHFAIVHFAIVHFAPSGMLSHRVTFVAVEKMSLDALSSSPFWRKRGAVSSSKLY
jgi:hypothetical protein